MLLAFAIAIAIHEIVAGLVSMPQVPPQAQREVVQGVTVARIVVRPTPTPAPPPPPPVVLRTHAIAPLESRTIARTTTGRAARAETIHRIGAARPRPPHLLNSKPIWDVPAGAQGAGAGTAAGAGSVGNGVSGTGTGDSGSGTGAGGGTQPCGFVEFMDPHGAHYDPQTRGFWVDVQMSVRFPDGHSESIVLDYPWYYPSASANPFEHADQPMLFQWPPSDKSAGEPALVQYVMQHSAPPGITLLKDCP